MSGEIVIFLCVVFGEEIAIQIERLTGVKAVKIDVEKFTKNDIAAPCCRGIVETKRLQ